MLYESPNNDITARIRGGLTRIAAFVVLAALLSPRSVYPWDGTTPLIIDHTCEDISQIPSEWIDSVQSGLRLHYAHTSHGGQLVYGLSGIEAADPSYDYALGSSSLPTEGGAFCIFDGQEIGTYITPDLYWETAPGMGYTRDVLDHDPTINVSMWAWCTQLEYYTEAQVQAYLDSLSALEAEYPGVIFVYMTGNAQATGSSGYNRHLRNEQIRAFCIENNKALYDFADLDSWWRNPVTEEWEEATYEYSGSNVRVEHPQFNGDEAAHTTYESCEQKGRALWWAAARIAGWLDAVAADEPRPERGFADLRQNVPNPFSHRTSISYYLHRDCVASLDVYDVAGRLVATLAGGAASAGRHEAFWDGRDRRGNRMESGIYFVRLHGPGGAAETRKLLILR